MGAAEHDKRENYRRIRRVNPQLYEFQTYFSYYIQQEANKDPECEHRRTTTLKHPRRLSRTNHFTTESRL